MAGREDAWWVYYDPTSGSNGPPAGGKRRLIREEGLASRVSSHVRPRDPEGGTVSTVSPRRMTIDDVSHTVKLSGGGGASRLQGFRQCGLRRPWLGTLPGLECPHDDVGIRQQMGTVRMSDDRVPSTNIESPYGGGASSLPGATGSLLPVKFPAVPILLADRPQLGSWQVAVVRVDETLWGTLRDGSVLVRSRIVNGRVTCLRYTAVLDRRVWRRCLPPQKLLELLFQCCWLGAPL